MPEIEVESPGTSGPVSPDRDDDGQQEAKGASPDGDETGGSSEGSVAAPSSPIRPQADVTESRDAGEAPGADWTLRSAVELVCDEKFASDEQVSERALVEAVFIERGGC